MKTVQIEIINFNEFIEKLETIESKLDKISKPTSTEKSWLTNQEVAKVLNVTPRTLQNYRDKGIISFSQVGSKIYYKTADIQKHLETHYVESFNVMRRIAS